MPTPGSPRRLIAEVPIRGYYIPDEYWNGSRPGKLDREYFASVRNKGYRNFGFLLHGWLTNTSQTIIDVDGTSRTVTPFRVTTATETGTYPSTAWNPCIFGLNLGSSSSPHDVSRYELYSRHFARPRGGTWWIEELDTETRLQTCHDYALPPPDRTVGEAGLYALFVGGGTDGGRATYRAFLLARAVLTTGTKPSGTQFKEGWRISFPPNYTRWFVRAFMNTCPAGATDWGTALVDTGGAVFAMRDHQPAAGGADVAIGSDNAPPSPTHHNLLSPIASLSGQAQVVEVDTALQEVRVVRTGSYTPATTTTLGEVALFTTVYDSAGTARKIMLCRAVWDPPVTLTAGTTYAIGIALKLG